jgi:hypothetical protein
MTNLIGGVRTFFPAAICADCGDAASAPTHRFHFAAECRGIRVTTAWSAMKRAIQTLRNVEGEPRGDLR